MATTRQARSATPQRWQQALERATTEGIQVRQLTGCGAWVATSGSDATVAYELSITGTIAHGCTCTAGEYGDPVCKHRAQFYADQGMLELADLAPAPETVTCGVCKGDGEIRMQIGARLSDFWVSKCRYCAGTGSQAVQLIAA